MHRIEALVLSSSMKGASSEFGCADKIPQPLMAVILLRVGPCELWTMREITMIAKEIRCHLKITMGTFRLQETRELNKSEID